MYSKAGTYLQSKNRVSVKKKKKKKEKKSDGLTRNNLLPECRLCRGEGSLYYRSGFPMSDVVVFFFFVCFFFFVPRIKVVARFDNTDEIVDHHCINFHLSIAISERYIDKIVSKFIRYSDHS